MDAGAYIGLKAFSKAGFWLNFHTMKRYYRTIYLRLHERLLDCMDHMGIGRLTPETRSALLNVSNADCRELASFSDWLNQFFSLRWRQRCFGAKARCGCSLEWR